MSTRAECPIDLLGWYANQTLSPQDQAAVEAHLASCADCRRDFAQWMTLRHALHQSDAFVPRPRADLFALVEAQLDDAPTARFPRFAALREQIQFVSQLMRAQVLLLRRDLWLASAIVLIVGWVASFLLSTQQGKPSGVALAVIAPLIAALGMSVIYGSDTDAGLELAMTSPTSPRQVLLARFVLVFGYDLALMLCLSLVFKLMLPAVDLNALIDLWLGPLFFLSGMALLLSLAIGVNAAVIGSLIVWTMRVFALANLGIRFNSAFLQTLTLFWSSTSLLVAAAAAFLIAGLALVKKEEHFL